MGMPLTSNASDCRSPLARNRWRRCLGTQAKNTRELERFSRQVFAYKQISSAATPVWRAPPSDANQRGNFAPLSGKKNAISKKRRDKEHIENAFTENRAKRKENP